MELPFIELASLPVLDTATALFGSLKAGKSSGNDDTIVAIMVYVYDVT